jgi:predicted enzyme related to lactoylglutathione lyase
MLNDRNGRRQILVILLGGDVGLYRARLADQDDEHVPTRRCAMPAHCDSLDARPNAARHGAVSWVDLSTPDIDGATRFYRELFGWTIARTETPMGVYFIATVDDVEVCGMMTNDESVAGAPAMWTVFFTVDDAEATLLQAANAGGAVLQPAFDIPGGARVGVVADPPGAMFAVISGGPRPNGPYFSQRPGAVGWAELLTRDAAVATGFYGAVFGWTAVNDDVSGYTEFTIDGASVCGMLPMPPDVPAEQPSQWATYFSVADCGSTQARCRELGGQILLPTMEIGAMRFAVLADPHGATFDVVEFIG